MIPLLALCSCLLLLLSRPSQGASSFSPFRGEGWDFNRSAASTSPLIRSSFNATAVLPPSAAGRLTFSLVLANAPWPGRGNGHLHYRTRATTFRTDAGRQVTLPSSFVLFGGYLPPLFSNTHNDVWVSGDGRTWHLKAGHTIDGDWAPVEASYNDEWSSGVASCMDKASEAIYMAGGMPGGDAQNQLWMTTTGGLTWRDQAVGARSPVQPRYYPALSCLSGGQLVQAAGIEISLDDPEESIASDVWLSSDLGRNWRQQTAQPPYSARIWSSSVTWQSAGALGGKDIVWVIAGQAQHDNVNDVWASSDEGRSWVAIDRLAPFPQRLGSTVSVTKDGLLILAGGYADLVEGDIVFSRESIENDVWVSADGGYSWGRCVQDAEWDDRYLFMATLDSAGYLYVAGGLQADAGVRTEFRDVWRSGLSFHDLLVVAEACGLSMPACGPGIRCWPGPETVVASDGSFVSCPACPHPSLAITAASFSSAALAVIGLLAVLAGLLVGTVVLLLRRLKQAQVDPSTFSLSLLTDQSGTS